MTNTTDIYSEAFDDDIADPSLSALLTESDLHKDVVLEYCQLALKPTLTDADQDRMAEILDMGAENAVLNFWLEEGDHLVAHRLGLIDESFIKNQQDEFRRSVRHGLIKSFWNDLQSRNKVLQAYLHRQGVYHGSIDGIVGPSTKEALRQLQEQQPSALNALTEFSFT
ncbi:peptidoglycan-binding domain-containing protein [Oscillatoria sp. CS-180]|uniref:peptidoglycan-binding domain-containing protein n=1 Tax=Oscillatoria sp. CS-180 TaxID=3021720 RepID=UPI0023311538|nr:peptidoglycan-binding domain-containing protein [Oscillatoria sp. CS-180]MDB9524510.1 peptidoglycan-binding domain-containing protein [Oscillatoria sp. CS-180]